MTVSMVTPSRRVAANRRRAFLWLLLLAGVLVSIAGGSMITVFNSLDVAGLALMVAAVAGFIREVEK